MNPGKHVIRIEKDGPDGAGLQPMKLDPADFQSPLPKQNIHVYYEDASIGLTVGVWDTTTMQEAFGPYPGDEFVWLLEGRFAMLDAEGNAVSAQEGDSVFIQNGAPVSWKQDGYLKKFFITCLDPKAVTPKIASAKGCIVVIDPGAKLTSISGEGEPMEREFVAVNGDTGGLTISVRDCEAATFAMEPTSTHEFVQTLEGEVTIIEENGNRLHFTAGDCFFIPKGTVCQRHVPKYVKMYRAGLNAG